MTLRVGLDRASPDWNDALWASFAFGVVNVVLWHLVLVVWERWDYVGSLEWGLARIKGSKTRTAGLSTEK